MDTAHSNSASAPLTAWAQKYGPMRDNKGVVISHKSGFTPIDIAFPSTTPLSKNEQLETHRIEKFQRHELYGFTTNELAQLDCLLLRDLRRGNLPPNAILPILQRGNWETTPQYPDWDRTRLYPLHNGNGMWVANNDEVWRVMEPICSLATRMLLSVHLLPWFDALLNGKRSQIPNSRLPMDFKGESFQSFHARPTFSQFDLAQQRDQTFEKLRIKFGYFFGFSSPHKDDEHVFGLGQTNEVNSHGITGTNIDHMQDDVNPDAQWRLASFLNYATPERLMGTDLNSAERKIDEWHAANTIAHEIMHAVAFLDTHLAGKVDLDEPFFEDEPLSEIGFSFEQAINFSITSPFPHQGPPLGFWIMTNWPDFRDTRVNDPALPILQNPGPKMWNDIYPIPLSFYEDVQQEDFWSIAVRKFGHGLLQFRAIKEGAHIKYTLTDKKTKGYRRSRTERISVSHPFPAIHWKLRKSVKTLKEAQNLSPEDRTALQFGLSFLAS